MSAVVYDSALVQLTITGRTSPVRRRPSTVDDGYDDHDDQDDHDVQANHDGYDDPAIPSMRALTSKFLSRQIQRDQDRIQNRQFSFNLNLKWCQKRCQT